jgi:membrane protease YdiL (CAAX protease family)
VNGTISDASNRQSQSVEAKVWDRTDRMRLLMWAGIAFFPALAIQLALHSFVSRNELTIQSELPFRALFVFFVSVATWMVSRMEKRSLAEYGIDIHQALGRRFWEGSVWGFAMLSAVVLVLWISGHVRIESAALTGLAVVRWALAWGLTFLAVSLSEEFSFRGYWLFSMSRRMRFWPAALFLSCIFGVAHLTNHGENVMGLLHVLATGLLFCLMIRRTGTLWFAVGFHAAWDWSETFFYGTPDSGLLGVGHFLNSSVHGPNWITGGAAGPEGSIVAIFVMALCALLISYRFPKAIYPDRPV